MTTDTTFGLSVDTPLAYEEADARVRDLLKGEGFGVLTEIDVRATLKAKLDVDFSALHHPRRLQPAVRPPRSAVRARNRPAAALQYRRRRARRGWLARVLHGPAGGAPLGRQPRHRADRYRGRCTVAARVRHARRLIVQPVRGVNFAEVEEGVDAARSLATSGRSLTWLDHAEGRQTPKL